MCLHVAVEPHVPGLVFGALQTALGEQHDVVALFDLLVLGGAAAAGAEMPEEARAVLEELQERFKNVESPRAELLARLEALVEDDGWRFERERVRGG